MGFEYSSHFAVGGSKFVQLPQEVAYDLIMEALQARLFNPSLLDNSPVSSTDHTFKDNQEFWHAAISGKLRETMRVCLSNCTVTEWIPQSPRRVFCGTKNQQYIGIGSNLRDTNRSYYGQYEHPKD
ncbi:MAG: hypothetical protein GPJ21_23045 [Microcystis aeruginosa W13-11]|jgi:hypothetical protein|nr:hypothetical protein [Microcystis aeruginosa W13-11]